ncbi:MAG: hypothetical protein AB1540_04645 [Bdellovibrionota bacterium]
MERAIGRFFLILTLLLILFSTGCNFFGKEDNDGGNPPVGQLSDGKSIIGSWTASSASVDVDGNPEFAITNTYTFDPAGGARIDVTDGKSATTICTGYGQYRNPNGNDVIIYVQGATPSNCGFNSQIHLSQVEVFEKTIRFKDPESQETYAYFKVQPQPRAPVGVWDFDGAGGIDYLFLDKDGYFLIQSTDPDTSEMFLYVGIYSIIGAELRLGFFMNMDPSQLHGYWVFSQFVTDGQVLELLEDTEDGQFAYTGIRL